ncbi:MAG TPA: hypothetical protein VKH44_04915, partial [Pirellulaceae bacterium]|nr:hypothetical protein [Pirellulaceae bacterium]
SEAAKVPLPPVGGRPKQWELDLEGESLTLAIAPHTWLDNGYFSATPETLRRLADEFSKNLPAADSRPEFEVSLTTDSGHRWQLVVGIAEAEPHVE